VAVKHLDTTTTLGYLEKTDSAWTEFDVVREIYSNALDQDPHATLRMEGNDLVVRNTGSPMKERHLLMGVSEKDNPEARGMFGEGIKLALLVLERMGLRATIHTGDLLIWNARFKRFGEDVFRISYESADTYYPGTEVRIHDWNRPTYLERFVLPGDPRILFTDNKGRMILREDQPAFYVKGVYVTSAVYYNRPYHFGYNLMTVPMNRDRKMVESYQVGGEIGCVWSECDNLALWRELLTAVKENNAEERNNIYNLRARYRDIVQQAWLEIMGKGVLHTDSNKAREAGYLGSRVVDMGYIGNFLQGIVTTDADIVLSRKGELFTAVSEKLLTDRRRRILSILRKQAEKVNDELKIVIGRFANEEVVGEYEDGVIRIADSRLANPEDALETLIHELAHAVHHTEDATADHASAMGQIAARLLRPYLMRD
jgi:hypothetical protein